MIDPSPYVPLSAEDPHKRVARLEAELSLERDRNRFTQVLRMLSAQVSAHAGAPMVAVVGQGGHLEISGAHSGESTSIAVLRDFLVVWFPGALVVGANVLEFDTPETLLLACYKAVREGGERIDDIAAIERRLRVIRDARRKRLGFMPEDAQDKSGEDPST